MSNVQKHRPKLRLVPPSHTIADADWLAASVMEQFDKTMPELFAGRPLATRASARNIIVRTLLTQRGRQ
jgi:hypothetical protein